MQTASQKMTTTEKWNELYSCFNLSQPVFFHLSVQCSGIYFQQSCRLFAMSVAYLKGFDDGFFLCILVFQWQYKRRNLLIRMFCLTAYIQVR